MLRRDKRTRSGHSSYSSLAILDIGLPDMDGYTLARRIRELRPGVTLALTEWGQEKDRQLAFEAGFDPHRTKTVDPMQLLAAIAGLREAAATAIAEHLST